MKRKELIAWRKKNGYSQSELAKILGVAVMTVSRWETGVRTAPPFLALALESVMRNSKTKRRK